MKIIVVFLLFLSIANIAHGADVYAWKLVIKKENLSSSYSFTEDLDLYGPRFSHGGGIDTYTGSSSAYITLLDAVFTDEDTGTETNVSFHLDGGYRSSTLTVNKSDYLCSNITEEYSFLVVKLKQAVVHRNQQTKIPVEVYCDQSYLPYLD